MRMIEADNDSDLNRIHIYNLRSFGGNILFECNISEIDICKFTQKYISKRRFICLVQLHSKCSHIKLQACNFAE